MPSLAQVAAALGGEVRGLEVFAPGPGHSDADRSLAVKLDAAAPDGFVVYSFSGDDPIASKDYVRRKLGLGPFEPNGNASGGRKSWTFVSEHIYLDEHGEPYLRVRRFLDGNGKKQYPQYHWANGTWAKNAPKGPRLPYRLKGYYRRDFDDAFGRYLDPAQHDFGPMPQNLPLRRHEVDEIDVSRGPAPAKERGLAVRASRACPCERGRTGRNWQCPEQEGVDPVANRHRWLASADRVNRQELG